MTYREVPIRGESWYVNPLLLVFLVAALLARTRYGMGLRGCYVAAVARSTRARLIVTYIDNNNWDLGLANYINRRIVCIQNATRPRWYVNKLHKNFDCYLVYTPPLVNPSDALNIHAREALTVGHLKMGIFLEDVRAGRHPDLNGNAGTLVWVSSYREPEAYEEEQKEIRDEYIRAMQIGVSHMARYAAETGCEARVALASHKKKRPLEAEKACLNTEVRHDLHFSVFTEQGSAWISYKEIWPARLVLGINSTLLFESAAIGKRTVLVLPTERVRQEVLEIGPLELLEDISVFGDSYREFSAKCDQVLGLSEEQYARIVDKIRSTVCYIDPRLLPQERIRRRLEQLLGEASDASRLAEHADAEPG